VSSTQPQNSSSKYAWQQVSREDEHKRSAVERVADFLEIHGVFDEATAREQASRCIQCPEPLCVQGCPLSNRIPEWLALTAEGHFIEAAALLHSTSSLPEICAHLCPADAKCEAMCVVGGKSEPVSIRAIEQFLNRYAFDHDQADAVPAPPNGFRVAVIGSGPGGLACADALSRRGYEVTVLDGRLVPGGLLVNGAPSFRLDRSVVERRINLLEKRGVSFRLGIKLGEDLTHAEVRQQFDAVYLALGARRAREWSIPGQNLKGVAQALSFLVHSPMAKPPTGEPPIDVKGARVVVIGGGDMAIDCLRLALRAGAREALGIYRRGEAQMPCSRDEYRNALEEGARFEFLAAPVAVLGTRGRKVKGVRLVRTELGKPGPDGRASFASRPGTEFEIPADYVLTALGFEPMPLPEDALFSELPRTDQGQLWVDENLMTRERGVFAGGELVRGPSPILDVVRDARQAADGIHQYLQPHAA
jgi:glutamate synthase (NADPH/NADH) small chain